MIDGRLETLSLRVEDDISLNFVIRVGDSEALFDPVARRDDAPFFAVLRFEREDAFKENVPAVIDEGEGLALLVKLNRPRA